MANIFFKYRNIQNKLLPGIACNTQFVSYLASQNDANGIAGDTRERKLENGKPPDEKQLKKIIH